MRKPAISRTIRPVTRRLPKFDMLRVPCHEQGSAVGKVPFEYFVSGEKFEAEMDYEGVTTNIWDNAGFLTPDGTAGAAAANTEIGSIMDAQNVWTTGGAFLQFMHFIKNDNSGAPEHLFSIGASGSSASGGLASSRTQPVHNVYRVDSVSMKERTVTLDR
ncbi:hypothetical protein HC928_00625 [bacterium]|nr:hypothetical protein [bacterium]